MRSAGINICTAVKVQPAELRPPSTSPAVPGHFGTFPFDIVLGEEASQTDVYNEIAKPFLDAFLRGEDCIVTLYGAAQTGKTYSLEGVGGLGNARDGMVPRALVAVLRHLNLMAADAYHLFITYSGLTAGHEGLLYDLLTEGGPPTSIKEVAASLALQRLKAMKLAWPEDIHQVMKNGRAAKALALSGQAAGPGSRGKPSSPAMHTMLTVHLDTKNAQGGWTSSRISFVELAPTESKDPLNFGQPSDAQLARSLATSYSTLGKVLLALRQGGRPGSRAGEGAGAGPGHVPWRDSPLTRWLQDKLQSAAHLMLVATVSASSEAAQDTLATLNYVSKFRTGRHDAIVISAVWDDNTAFADAAAAASAAAAAARAQILAAPRLLPSAEDMELCNQASPDARQGSSSPRPRSPGRLRLTEMPAQEASSRPARPVSPRRQQRQQDEQIQMMTLQPKPGPQLGSTHPMLGQASPRSLAAQAQLWQAESEQDAEAYGELLTLLRRSQCGMRAESLLERLLHELCELRAESMTYGAQNQSLLVQYEGLQQHHARQSDELAELQQAAGSMRQELADVRTRYAEAEEERGVLLRRLRQLETEEMPAAQRREKASSEEAVDTSRRLMQAEAELEATREQMSERTRQLREQLDDLEARERSLQGRLHDTQAAAQQAAQDHHKEAQRRTEEVQQLQLQVRQLTQEVQMLQGHAADAATEADAEHAACQALQHELSTTKAREQQLHGADTRARELQVQLARAQGSLEAASSERDGLRQLISKAEEKMSQLVRQLEAEVAARRDVEQQCDLHSLEAAAASSRAESLQQHAEQLEGIIQDLREQEVHAGKHITQQEDSIVQLQEQLGGLMAVMGSFAEDLERLVPTQWRYLIEGPPRNALQMQDAAGWGRRLNGVLEMIRLAGQQLQEMTSQHHQLQSQAGQLQHQLDDLRCATTGQGEMQARLQAAVEERQGKLGSALDTIKELQGKLQATAADLQLRELSLAQEASKHQVREEALAAITAERDQLQATIRQQQDMTRHMALKQQEGGSQLLARDHLLDSIWMFLRDYHQHDALPSHVPSGSPRSHRAGALSPAFDAASQRLSGPDWGDLASHKALFAAVSNLKVEVSKLQRELLMSQDEHSLHAELRRRLTAAQHDYQALQASYSRLQQSKLEHEATAGSAQQQLEETRSCVASLTSSLQQARAQVQSLTTSKERLEQQLADTQDELADAAAVVQQVASGTADDRLGVQAQQVVSSLRASKLQVAELQDKLRVVQARHEVLEQELQACQAALHDAESKAAQLESVKAEADDMKQAASSGRTAQVQLQKQLEMAETSRDTWRDLAREREEQLEGVLGQLATAQSELAAARAEVYGAKDESYGTTQRVQELERSVEQGRAATSNLVAKLAAAEKEAAEARQQAEQLSAKVQQLQQVEHQLAGTRAALQEATQQATDAQSAAADAAVQGGSAGELQAALAAAGVERRRLQQAVDQLGRECDDLGREKQALQQQLERTQLELVAQVEANGALAKGKANMSTALEAARLEQVVAGASQRARAGLSRSGSQQGVRATPGSPRSPRAAAVPSPFSEQALQRQGSMTEPRRTSYGSGSAAAATQGLLADGAGSGSFGRASASFPGATSAAADAAGGYPLAGASSYSSRQLLTTQLLSQSSGGAAVGRVASRQGSISYAAQAADAGAATGAGLQSTGSALARWQQANASMKLSKLRVDIPSAGDTFAAAAHAAAAARFS